MALIINPTKKRKSMSVLASDLSGNIEFNSKQTLPMMDIASDKYNEGMNLYLQKLGVTKIDESYNEAIKQFESQLQEQELAARMQANLAAESAANMAVEAQANLGTGAAAIAAEGRKAQLSDIHEGIDESITETYVTGVQELSEQYQQKLESVLGKYDPTTQTFAGLSEYQAMANLATQALMKSLARSLVPDIDTQTDDYKKVLIDAGYITQDSTLTNMILTPAGETKLEQLVNGVDVNIANPALGDKRLDQIMAEEMAKEQYPEWDQLSELKKAQIKTEYESWIWNNQNNLRLSSWDLFYYNKEGEAVIDTEYTREKPSITDVNIHDEEGIYVERITNKHLDYSSDNLAKLKIDIASGKYDGGYIAASEDINENTEWYYVEKGMIYKTEYTIKNSPNIVDINNASIYSFGFFKDTGKGTDHRQDIWVNEVIESAKAGTIPDGTYIQMNYGASADKAESGWYKYESGKFIKASGDKLVKYGNKVITLQDLWKKKWSTDNVLYYRGSAPSSKVDDYLQDGNIDEW